MTTLDECFDHKIRYPEEMAHWLRTMRDRVNAEPPRRRGLERDDHQTPRPGAAQ